MSTSLRRRVSALAVVGGLAGLSLVLGAGPALAAGSISNPVDGATYDSATPVNIKASGSARDATSLTLSGPGFSETTVDQQASSVTASSFNLGYDFYPDCVTYPSSSCRGYVPAANGTWTIKLTGGATDQSTFRVRIPPRKPDSVTASAQGYRAVTVGWRRGAEPDLTGYALYDNGAVSMDNITCQQASCSTTVTYDRDGTGAHSYTVVAKRSAAAGSAETLSSAPSDGASATLGSPPPPSPTSSPTTGSSGSGGSGSGSTSGSGTTTGSGSGNGSGSSASPAGGSGGRSSSGGSPAGSSGSGSSGGSSAVGTSGSGSSSSGAAAAAVAQRKAFGLSFSAFGPKLGIPKLPPLPATEPAVAAPLADGTYEKTLGYKSVTTREKVSAPDSAVSRIGDAVGISLDADRLAKSIASALVLLLVAAHLRRWLGDPGES